MASTEEALLEDLANEARELAQRLPVDIDPGPNPPPPTTEIGFLVSLHTDDPGESGTANEVSYAGYKRSPANIQPIKNGVGFRNARPILFPACTGEGVSVSHFVLWAEGKPVTSGPLSSRLYMTPGMLVQFAANSIRITMSPG